MYFQFAFEKFKTVDICSLSAKFKKFTIACHLAILEACGIS